MTTKIRWYGRPGEEQPDAGDVLAYVDPFGRKPDWWHLVHYAWRVRGKGPEDLWLMVERLDFVDCPPFGKVGIPDVVADAFTNGNWFSAYKRRRVHPRT